MEQKKLTYIPDEHMVLLYYNDDEVTKTLVEYIEDNLKRNIRCIYITGDANTEKIISNLKKAIDYDSYIYKGQFIILDKSDAYAKSGVFNPDKMVELLISEANSAKNDGFEGLAISGEISWVLEYKDGFDKIMEYEWKINDQVFSKYDVSSICRYNMNKFSNEMILNIIQVHPFIIWKNEINENPFYVPAGGYKLNRLKEYQVKQWLKNISTFSNAKSEFARELKSKEQKLLESENNYMYIFDNLPIGHSITTLDGRLNANKAFYNMMGYTKEELKGQTWEKYTHPDDIELSKRITGKLLDGKENKINFEKRYIKKDGSILWADIYANIRKDENGKPMYYMTSVIDITEKKQLEANRLEIEAQVRNKQKLESIGTLASGVAHEINNPINGIMNYGQIILDSDPNDEDIKVYAKEIVHETNRIAKIVRNLLDFSRKSRQEHSYANIEDIIKQTVSLINTVMIRDQIELVIDIDDDLPNIKCRSQQIQQVIMNLLTNSQDALNDKYKGYHENKIIKLDCSEYNADDRKWLRITVEDHGNGIPDEIIENIFDPFFTTKGRYKGTGLGLSISYGIVSEHHGNLRVETKENEYTRFIVELPCDNGWDLED